MSGLLTLYTNQPWLVLLSPTRGSLLDSDAPETPNPQIEWFSLWSVRSSPDPAPRQPPQTDCLDFVLCILFSYTSLFLLLKGCVLAKISFSFVTFSHSNFNLCSLAFDARCAFPTQVAVCLFQLRVSAAWWNFLLEQDTADSGGAPLQPDTMLILMHKLVPLALAPLHPAKETVVAGSFDILQTLFLFFFEC